MNKFGKPGGYEEKRELKDKDVLIPEGEEKKAAEGTQPSEEEIAKEKSNASERINLQNIMELREAFDLADLDSGGALELEEFIEAFGEVIGKHMNMKELKQLFMKIDADSNGSVEWPEFMNYMLLENQTLALMKKELSEYIPSKVPDPKPSEISKCHSKPITCMEYIVPDNFD